MKYASLSLVALIAHLAVAQAPDTTHRVPGTTVRGIVLDSVTNKPLAEAKVQIVAADNPARFVLTAISDSLGRFALMDVPIGRYTIGFFHPILDSLGVEAPLREVALVDLVPAWAELAVPSPARLRTAICGVQTGPDLGAVVVGIVRDAGSGAPVAGVKVTGQWREFSFTSGHISHRIPHLTATTGENGWFAICNLPSAGTVALVASSGADSTGVIEVLIPQEGFVRRELYIGLTHAVAANAAATGAAPVARATKHTGDGRLTGSVVASLGGQPLAGAQVSIADGPETRADDRGEWTLADAPVGTRVLEVRAIGYYPERRRVDIVAGAPPVRIELSTLKAVLDTVKVRANRFVNRDRGGFLERRHIGVGRYMTPGDIAKRPAVFLTDLFKTTSGIRIGVATDTLQNDMVLQVAIDDLKTTDRRVLMHGISGNWCAPAIFLEGIFVPELDADALDAWLRPRDVAGIEIYSEATVPPEFQRARSGCGSIVIWSK